MWYNQSIAVIYTIPPKLSLKKKTEHFSILEPVFTSAYIYLYPQCLETRRRGVPETSVPIHSLVSQAHTSSSNCKQSTPTRVSFLVLHSYTHQSPVYSSREKGTVYAHVQTSRKIPQASLSLSHEKPQLFLAIFVNILPFVRKNWLLSLSISLKSRGAH